MEKCYLIYYRNCNSVVPVAVFTKKEDAEQYIKENPMIQFDYTHIWELPFNDMNYKS